MATGRALAAAIRREECDLVLTGSQSDDNGFGATGTVVAGLLDWPHAWLVMGVEVEEGARTLKVTREMESGLSEVFRLALPAVLEVQAGLNHPRYASLKGIMSAKKKEIAELSPGRSRSRRLRGGTRWIAAGGALGRLPRGRGGRADPER